MNSQLVFRNIGRFFLLMLLQLFVFDNIYLGGYINPCLYLLFVAMLPTGMNAIPMMLLAFGTGLLADISSNMMGFNTFACTAMGFLRGVWLDKILRGDNENEIDTPSIRTVPYQQYLLYLFLFFFIFNLLYHSLLVFDIREFFSILLTAILSTLITCILAILYQTLIFKKEKKSEKIAFVALLVLSGTASGQVAVGKWRDHLSYSQLFHVEAASDRIYCSSADGLFYYDLDDLTITRLNKTTTLSDVGVSTFAYDPSTHNVVVAYTNANVDIIKDDKVFNLNDIRRSNIGGSKKINSISFNNHKAYLSSAFGIVVVDMNRDEISETYYLGADGGTLNINDVAFTDSLIVAATDSGLYYAPKSSPLLSIVTTWSRDEGSLLAGRRIVRLAVDGDNRLLAMVQESGDSTIYKESGSMIFAPFIASDVCNFRVSQDRVVVCKSRKVDIYDRSGNLMHSVVGNDWMDMQPNDAVLSKEGSLWVAHNWASLVSVVPGHVSSLITLSPGGPWTGNAYSVSTFDSTLYVSPGGHRTTYMGVYNPADLFTYKNSDWSALRDNNKILTGKYDVIHSAVNPRDKKSVLAAVWGSGIAEIYNNEVVGFYDETNTNGALIRFQNGDFNALFTGGIAFDKRGNAWITNSLTDAVLVVRYSDGLWKKFNTMGIVNSDIDHIVWDSINEMKLFWGRQNRIFVHDGVDRIAYIDPNNGSRLQTSMVNALVQDHNGSLWMGTNKGIKVIYNLAKVFDNGGYGEMSPVTCNNILFNENDITEYLMAYENVTCIAVDGANRKWVGTSTGGLYLLSANGLQQLEHFTAANSPLFSDKIMSLAIMPWTGELFVVTDRGLQSYRASATYAFTEPMKDIHAFPNPVRPDYDGLIAIKGFTRNAIVHITDAAGNTVFSTHADGGQAVWDGRTHDGKKVASGVYYVFASAADGSMRSATKILIVR